MSAVKRKSNRVSDKSRAATAILAATLGMFGVDDIYLGRTARGLIRALLALLGFVCAAGGYLLYQAAASKAVVAAFSGGEMPSTDAATTYLILAIVGAVILLAAFCAQVTLFALAVAGKAHDGEGDLVFSWAGKVVEPGELANSK